MDPKDRLKKTQELIDAFEDLAIEDTYDQVYVLRLAVQALFPSLIIRDYPHD